MGTNDKVIGGGSGGSPDVSANAKDHTECFDGAFKISAQAVALLSRPPVPPAPPGPNVISLLATDLLGTGEDGTVEVKGAKGVRITAGPPALVAAHSDSTNGVEIAVGEIQSVTIQRGLLPGVYQKIEMTPSGITVDAGTMPITIQSLTQITLSVAGGLSTITLAPEGVTIQGVLVQIN
jgi:hypothetical protein